MKITVCGYMIRHPVAGSMLAYFNYLLGLHRLGHQVCYLEESGWPNSCYNPENKSYGNDPAAGISKVVRLLGSHDLNIPFYYIDQRTIYSKTANSDWDEIRQVLSDCDLLINLGGVCDLAEFSLCRRRALVDMDPLFTQIGAFGFSNALHDYNRHFSYGINIGQPGCTIPAGSIQWHPTVPPVVTQMWQESEVAIGSEAILKELGGSFSTLANWSAYGSVTHEGIHYGQKNEEFLKIIEFPGKTSQPFVLALSGADPEVRESLRRCGWHLFDGGEISASLRRYQSFIVGSRGEFSVAKNAYVQTRSGWFSDRSVCYLAAGRPVVLQDTGFTQWLPRQAGVLAFSSMKEAQHCIDAVNADYNEHCRGALEVARTVFDYKIVLPRMLETACG
jgi:hypothetical protein